MRTSIMIGLLGAVLLAFTTGCVSFSSVTYPTEANPTSAPKDIRIHADNKQALSLALVLQTTNHHALTVLPAESSLTDGQGRHYQLEFAARTNYAVGDWHWSWYLARAYGPLPKAAHVSFGSGHYTIAVAYAEDGEHRVAQTAFAVDRRSVPFFILWFSLLAHPIGPCG